MTNLAELHERNKRWRAWMDANTPFKTPDTLDALRLALVASARALEAWVNQTHARNNERASTINQELADVAMMILTALDSEPTDNGIENGFDIDNLCDAANDAVIECRYHNEWVYAANDVFAIVLEYPGFDLATELDACHTRLGLKHGGVTILDAIAQTGVVPWEVDDAGSR
jgi:hypothetical protein